MLSTIPFSGFYNSLHDMVIDDTIEQMFSDDYGNVNDGLVMRVHNECKFSEVFLQYAQEYVTAFADEFDINGVVFDELDSPREYNFTTDRIFIKLPLGECKRIFEYVCKDELQALISERFTSCDGFTSFYSNDLSSWGDIAEWDHNQLGTLLECYANDSREFDSMAEIDLLENARCNGNITIWVENATPSIVRLYNVHEYLINKGE